MKTLTEHNADTLAEITPSSPSPAGVLCSKCNTEMNIATLSTLNTDPVAIAAGDIDIIPVSESAATLVQCPNCDYIGYKL